MVHSLYIAAAGSVSLDIRDDAKITAIVIAANDQAPGGAEVSFTSTAQLTTNDTTGVLAGLPLAGSLAPATMMYVMNEPVEAGERLYLHVTGANACRAFVYTDRAGARPSTRRR